MKPNYISWISPSIFISTNTMKFFRITHRLSCSCFFHIWTKRFQKQAISWKYLCLWKSMLSFGFNRMDNCTEARKMNLWRTMWLTRCTWCWERAWNTSSWAKATRSISQAYSAAPKTSASSSSCTKAYST